ncbi:MAG: hypothetical protein ACOYMN_05315 [Roseimicrobium sp.]
MKTQTLALYALLTSSALATPSGLNNIPTADTVPHCTVAVQAFDTFSTGSDDFWLGFKTGWNLADALHLEWGLDSHLSPDPAGPLYFQTKLGFSPWEDGKIAVGVANVGLSSSDRVGDPFTYAVLTQDLHVARLSVGYGLQTDANTALIGLDRTFQVFERNLNLNADLVQTGDQSGWLTSVGAKYDLTKHIVLESWVNLPDEGDASVVAKINFVFTF